ncbi:Proteasome subunit beta type-4 [Marasmius sp. AFHP31]|nr:Proteasome subunit beta type-4 [Marasmius sp. AFHP31]
METSFALTGKGYVLVAADTTSARSIVKMKVDEDKIKDLGSHLLMAYSGEPGDTVQFAEYVERNIRLFQIRNNYALRPSAAASWIRRSLAQSLRSRKPYSVNLLLGGYDVAAEEPHLYWIDYLGTSTEVPFAAHGYGSYFALSLLDRYHDPDASLEEGIATLKRCIDEVAKRLVVSPGKYKVKSQFRKALRRLFRRPGSSTSTSRPYTPAHFSTQNPTSPASLDTESSLNSTCKAISALSLVDNAPIANPGTNEQTQLLDHRECSKNKKKRPSLRKTQFSSSFSLKTSSSARILKYGPPRRILHPPPNLDTIESEIPTPIIGHNDDANVLSRTPSGTVKRKESGLLQPLRPPPWHFRRRQTARA